jgi:hypothetical protein
MLQQLTLTSGQTGRLDFAAQAAPLDHQHITVDSTRRPGFAAKPVVASLAGRRVRGGVRVRKDHFSSFVTLLAPRRSANRTAARGWP